MSDITKKRLFISYARSDDLEFVRRLYNNLTDAGFWAWFDEANMPSRQLSFLQEIRDAIAACDRLVLIIGPSTINSGYVEQEWRFALQMGICINPIVRLNAEGFDGYELIPEELKLIHAEDFRNDSHFSYAIKKFIRQLEEPIAPLGRLFAVPELPVHYRIQRERLVELRNQILADVLQPVVVTGAAGKVGVQGMGGIGKSVLAIALARDTEVRRVFPDGVLWIRVGQQPNLLDLVRRLVSDLGERTLLNDLHSAREVLRESLESRAVLLIADDVWQRSHIDVFDVIGYRCRLLITTRDNSLARYITGKTFNLELPKAAEGYELLAAAARLPSANALGKAAKDVAKECGWLPLALSICGAMVAGGISWEDLYVALVERDLEFVATEYALESHHASIWRAIELSVQALPEDLKERFIELAVFPIDDKVPEMAVVTLWNHTGKLTDRHARRYLVELHERSLVQIDQFQSASNVISCHDLIYDFAVRLASKRHGKFLKNLHNQVLEAYALRCDNGWASGPSDDYFFSNLRNHLVAAGRRGELMKLVQDLAWLEIKFTTTVSQVNSYDLLEDFTLVLNKDYISFSNPLSTSGSKGIQSTEELFVEFLAHLIRSHIATWMHAPENLYAQLYPFLNTPAAPASAKKWLDRYFDNYTRRNVWFRQISPLTHLWEHILLSIPVADPMNGLFVIDSQQKIILGGVDGCVQAWSLATGRQLMLHRMNQKVLLLRERKDAQDFIMLLENGELYRIGIDLELDPLASPGIFVKCADLSPDSQFIIVASNSGSLALWNLDTGVWQIRKAGGRTSIRTINFDASGNRILITLGSGTCRILDSSTLAIEPGGVIQENIQYALPSNDGSGWYIGCLNGHIKHLKISGEVAHPFAQTGSFPVCAMAITKSRLLAGDTRGVLRCWQIQNDIFFEGYASWADGSVRCLHANDNLYVVSRDHEPLRISSQEAAIAMTNRRQLSIRTKPVWSEDGASLLAGNVAGNLLLQKDFHSLPQDWIHVEAAFNGASAIAKSFWVAAQESGISVIDYQKKKKLVSKGVATPTSAIDIHSNGKLTISGHANGDGVVWETASSGEIGRILMHVGPVTALLFMLDESKVISSGQDGTMALWDLKLREAGGSSGQWMVYVNSSLNSENDELKQSRTLPQLTHNEIWRVENKYKKPITALSLSCDESILAVAAANSVILWSVKEHREVMELSLESGKLIDIKYSPDNRYLAGLTDDAVCIIWSLQTKKIIATYKESSPAIGCAWRRDGTQIAIVANGSLNVFDLPGLASSSSGAIPND